MFEMLAAGKEAKPDPRRRRYLQPSVLKGFHVPTYYVLLETLARLEGGRSVLADAVKFTEEDVLVRLTALVLHSGVKPDVVTAGGPFSSPGRWSIPGCSSLESRPAGAK